MTVPRRLWPVALALLLSACSRDAGVALTPGQQVYESIFNEVVRDAARPIAIARVTSGGTLEAPSALDLKEPPYSALPQDLLRRLVAVAGVHQPIDWQPVMVNAQFVDPAEAGRFVDALRLPVRARTAGEPCRRCRGEGAGVPRHVGVVP